MENDAAKRLTKTARSRCPPRPRRCRRSRRNRRRSGGCACGRCGRSCGRRSPWRGSASAWRSSSAQLLWFAVFYLLYGGFRYLRLAIPHPETRDQMLQTVFAAFFLALLVMLLFSSGIVLYGSLFRSREGTLLLTLPTREGRVFLHKFQEAAVLNSWGFLLLGSPLLLAFGIVNEAPWYYYALLLPFMAAFTYIPMALGAILCLALVRCAAGGQATLDSRRRALVSAGLAAGWWLLTSRESNLLTPAWFQEMTGRLQFTQARLLPSWWLSTGLLEAAHRNEAECLKFLALLIANALFWREAAIAAAVRVYRPAYEGVHGQAFGQRRTGAGALDAATLHALAPLPPGVRLMMLKDMRLFRRDPIQWSQFLIFFGLMVFYFINIHPFSCDIHYAGWLNMISFLNLSVVGLLMSTFTTRFIFPMVSLEGRRFWFLVMLPLRRETILWSKFVFALGGSALPCSALILLSDLLLGVPLLLVGVHQLTCLLLCLGLSGVAVGLGARLPNLREESPSRIAAGFGGTLNLVASTLYVLVIVVLTAMPFHFHLAADPAQAGSLPHVTQTVRWWLRVWMIGGTGAGIAVGLAATILPLWIGFRPFAAWSFERTAFTGAPVELGSRGLRRYREHRDAKLGAAVGNKPNRLGRIAGYRPGGQRLGVGRAPIERAGRRVQGHRGVQRPVPMRGHRLALHGNIRARPPWVGVQRVLPFRALHRRVWIERRESEAQTTADRTKRLHKAAGAA